MKNTNNTRKSTGILAIMLCCVIGSVDQMAQADEQAVKYNLGGGYLGMNTPWRGQGFKHISVPVVSVEYKNWRFGMEHGPVQYVLMREPVELAVSLVYRDETYNNYLDYDDTPSNARVFKGYKDPHGEVAGRFHFRYERFQFLLAQDITNVSNGLTVTAVLDIPLWSKGPGFQVFSSVGVYWQDADYVDHVYGVKASNADDSLGRFVYGGSESVNPYSSLTMHYAMTRHWVWVARYQYEKLDNAISDSPLVNKTYKQEMLILLSYHL
ncbi:MipA/OmpV family protein [Pseudomonas sp. HK3]